MDSKVFAYLDIESLKNLALSNKSYNQRIRAHLSEIWIGFLPIVPHFSTIVTQMNNLHKIIVHYQDDLFLTGFFIII
jgi:hypothetical protein